MSAIQSGLYPETIEHLKRENPHWTAIVWSAESVNSGPESPLTAAEAVRAARVLSSEHSFGVPLKSQFGKGYYIDQLGRRLRSAPPAAPGGSNPNNASTVSTIGCVETDAVNVSGAHPKKV